MKEKKSKKSAQTSHKKKTKKELEEKLQAAFMQVALTFGSAKKTKSIIEKFAKQLSKKIEFKVEEQTPTAEPEEVVAAIATENAAPGAAKKPVARKTTNKV